MEDCRACENEDIQVGAFSNSDGFARVGVTNNNPVSMSSCSRIVYLM
jgi:hypothetical protein